MSPCELGATVRGGVQEIRTYRPLDIVPVVEHGAVRVRPFRHGRLVGELD